MDSIAPLADILDELRRLGRGECIWCELEINHPAYSICPRRGQRPRLQPAEDGDSGRDVSEIARFGARKEYTLRMAAGEEDRLKAWRLVHREYLLHGYTQPQELDVRYSIHDALPDAAVFLVETAGEAIGTVTVYPDSPLGLPADEVYRGELDALRREKRSPVEIGRLAIRKDHVNQRSVLTNMFDALTMFARQIRAATDLVITVNPRHAIFYERTLLFERIGEQKDLDSVCGAPAVLLRLDLELEEQARRHARGEGPRPERPMGCHTLYSHVSVREDEENKVARMRRIHCPPADSFIRRYFVRVRPLIPNLPSPLRYFFEKCYPGVIPKADIRSSPA